MAKFNSDLIKLFNNFKNEQGNRYLGVNAGDNTDSKKAKKILSSENIFDVNGDGTFNQADIDMFVKGDVNGDKTISEKEMNFVLNYKKKSYK